MMWMAGDNQKSRTMIVGRRMQAYLMSFSPVSFCIFQGQRPSKKKVERFFQLNTLSTQHVINRRFVAEDKRIMVIADARKKWPLIFIGDVSGERSNESDETNSSTSQE
jgi:hypothetical protein